jgi:hypothetical protein
MFTKGLAKVSGILALCLFFSAASSAQYGGGTGGTTSGTGTGTSSTGSMGYGSGSGKAIGIGVGVAAGAAVGVALLVHHHHKATSAEASLTGCTQSALNGMSLKNETDNVTYMLLSKGASLQPGERVELNGAKAKEGSDGQVFHVKSVVKNYGACGSTTASAATVVANSMAVSAK